MKIAKVGKTTLGRVLSKPFGFLGGCGILLVLVVAMFAPFLAPYSPYTQNATNRLLNPSVDHPFGTDVLGRDTLSRIIYGTRVSVEAAFPTIAIALFLGSLLGLTAGYFPKMDPCIIVLSDTIKSFPPIILALALISFFGPGLTKVILVIAFTWIPNYARVMRAQVQRIRNNDYIEAERALGGSNTRIIFRHILPNAIAPLVILAAMDLPVVITYEAGLSFLGLGVRPPRASWGAILSDGYDYIRVTPWLVIFAGLALAIATLSFTLFGETLRDQLDPKLKRGGR